jgi:hypothetical protein
VSELIADPEVGTGPEITGEPEQTSPEAGE